MRKLTRAVFASAVGHDGPDQELPAGTEYEVVDEFESSRLVGSDAPREPNTMVIKTSDGKHWLVKKADI